MLYGRTVSKFVGILALLLAAAELVDGRVVNVSFGDNPSSALNGPAGGAGAVWNSWSPIDRTLLDSDGNSTTVEVAAEGEGPYGDWWCDMQLLSGGLVARDQEVKLVRISGLNPASTYDLYIACARGEREANTLFSPLGSTSSVTLQQADNRSARNGSSWVRGENYVLFQDFTPDATGTVVFSFTGVGAYGMLNGLQIIEMGEPATTYVQWAADPAHALTPGGNDGPFDDPDGDGLPNLVEFALGSLPKMVSTGATPSVSHQGEVIVFEYYRSDQSRPPATTQIVQYSTDLQYWESVAIQATSNREVMITDNGSFDRVRVAIANLGNNLFVRLAVKE